MDMFNIYNKNVHIHGNDNFQIVVTAEGRNGGISLSVMFSSLMKDKRQNICIYSVGTSYFAW